MACIEESISEREGKQFEEVLNSKVKLDMYKRFRKEVEFKRYLHGVGDAGTRLLFTLQKRGGCFDQCVWLPQLHYMTITCLGM